MRENILATNVAELYTQRTPQDVLARIEANGDDPSMAHLPKIFRILGLGGVRVRVRGDSFQLRGPRLGFYQPYPGSCSSYDEYDDQMEPRPGRLVGNRAVLPVIDCVRQRCLGWGNRRRLLVCGPLEERAIANGHQCCRCWPIVKRALETSAPSVSISYSGVGKTSIDPSGDVPPGTWYTGKVE
jgi:hypothetical protein